MDIYCLKCKAHKQIENPVPDVLKNFTPVARATCPDCGQRLLKILGGPPHGWSRMMKEAKENEQRTDG